MESVELACRLVLAAVFVVAAVTKLVDRPAFARALGQFGVPAVAIPALAFLLPAAELGVAVALIPLTTAPAAAVAAVALLGLFTAGVASVLIRGQEAECHCFGSVSSRPVGPATLVRNALLLAAAAVVAVGGAGVSATSWVGDLSSIEVVLTAVSAALALGLAFTVFFLVQLFRQNGRLWTQLDSLGAQAAPAGPAVVPIGEMAPSFAGADLHGRPVDLGDLLDRLPDRAERLMLLFVSADCSACDPLLPEVGRRQRDGEGDLELALIAQGSPEDVAAKCAEHDIEPALVIDDLDVPRPFGINGFPGAVIVDVEGRVAGRPAVGRAAIEELLEMDAGVPALVHVGGTA